MFARRLLDELRARPDMGQPALSAFATLSNMMNMFSFDPKTLGVDEKPTTLILKSFHPNYFATLAIPVLSNPLLGDRDTADATRLVGMKRALARPTSPPHNPLPNTFPPP